MNKAQLQDQIAPGSVGLAMATIYMTYGEWVGFVPANLTDVKYVALTAAVGMVCTALINVVRHFTTNVPTVINQMSKTTIPDAAGFGRRT